MCNGINERDEKLILESNKKNNVGIIGHGDVGKTFKRLMAMLEKSYENADRMIKLMDEMELQQDELLIENESLKTKLGLKKDIGYISPEGITEYVWVKKKSIDTLVTQFDDLHDKFPHMSSRPELIELCSAIYIQCAITNGFFKDGE